MSFTMREEGAAPTEPGEDEAPPTTEGEVPFVGPSPEEGLETLVEGEAAAPENEQPSEAGDAEPEDGSKPTAEEGVTEAGVDAEAVPAEATESEGYMKYDNVVFALNFHMLAISALVESNAEPAEANEAPTEGTTEVSDAEPAESEAPTTDQEEDAA